MLQLSNLWTSDGNRSIKEISKTNVVLMCMGFYKNILKQWGVPNQKKNVINNKKNLDKNLCDLQQDINWKPFNF